MKIIKIAKNPAAIYDGFWITPQGQTIHVGFGEHAYYIAQHPEIINLSKSQMLNTIEGCHMEALTALAIQKGFIHVRLTPHDLYVQANSQNLIQQHKDTINQMAIDNRITPIWSTSTFSQPTIKTSTTAYLNELPSKECMAFIDATTKLNKIAYGTWQEKKESIYDTEKRITSIVFNALPGKIQKMVQCETHITDRSAIVTIIVLPLSNMSTNMSLRKLDSLPITDKIQLTQEHNQLVQNFLDDQSDQLLLLEHNIENITKKKAILKAKYASLPTSPKPTPKLSAPKTYPLHLLKINQAKNLVEDIMRHINNPQNTDISDIIWHHFDSAKNLLSQCEKGQISPERFDSEFNHISNSFKQVIS